MCCGIRFGLCGVRIGLYLAAFLCGPLLRSAKCANGLGSGRVILCLCGGGKAQSESD